MPYLQPGTRRRRVCVELPGHCWGVSFMIGGARRLLRLHRGNADVVRQDLQCELGIEVSLRTVERAVAPMRRQLRAAALATVRFETAPGQQLQSTSAARGR